MYNLRYHIVTIVSVFSALALGLILGGLIVGDANVAPTGLVTDLKTEFSNLRSENKALSEDVTAYIDFTEPLVSDAITTMLAGKTEVVLGLNSRAATLAKETLESAGAQVISVTVDSASLDMAATTSATQAIASIMNEQSFTDPYDAIGFGLAGEWAKDAAGVKPFTEALEAQGVISIKGSSASGPEVIQAVGGIDGIVNVAAASGKPDDLSLAITRQFAKKQYRAASASLFRGSTDPAVKSWEQGVSATTMLGSPIGSYSLVALMAGADQGLYGSGPGAKDIAPKMPSRPAAINEPSKTDVPAP